MINVYQDAGNLKWFIEVDGLMDVDAGYFDTEEAAKEYADDRYSKEGI